jgi:hypothetical protein
MPDSLRKKFKLLPDEEFWKLSPADRLQYLNAAAEVSAKRPVKRAKHGSKKRSLR